MSERGKSSERMNNAYLSAQLLIGVILPFYQPGWSEPAVLHKESLIVVSNMHNDSSLTMEYSDQDLVVDG